LPTYGISLHQVPGVLVTFHFLIAQQVLRLSSFPAGLADNQHQRLVQVVWVPARHP
jgi:hypothetical protein